MVNTDRQAQSLLDNFFVSNARNFDFRQAALLVDSMRSPDAAIGLGLSADKEKVLFRAAPSMGFPSADIAEINILADNKIELTVNFLGLYGPASPLPAYFTEAIIAEDVKIENEDLISYFLTSRDEVQAFAESRINIQEMVGKASNIRKKVKAGVVTGQTLTDKQINQLKNGTEVDEVFVEGTLDKLKNKSLVLEIYQRPNSNQRDFLDLFNHRLISLFYRCVKKYRPHLEAKRNNDSSFEQILFSAIGAPIEDIREASSLNWHKLLKYTGLLAMNTGCPELICKVVSGYFGMSVEQIEIEEGVLRFAQVPEDQQNRLGKANITLTEDFVCGESVPDRKGKFRVHLLDLSLAKFSQFLPLQDDPYAAELGQFYEPLKELLTFMRPAEQQFDICLHLRKDEVSPFSLQHDALNRLGWSCWLTDSQPLVHQVII